MAECARLLILLDKWESSKDEVEQHQLKLNAFDFGHFSLSSVQKLTWGSKVEKGQWIPSI